MPLGITQIKETCLYVQDLDATITFYRDKLELKLFSHVSGSHAFFRAGTSVLLCFDPESARQKSSLPSHFGEGELHIAFEVERRDYKSAKEKVMAAGIEIEHEETWSGGHHSFYFRDPDRHLLEIVEMGMWG